MGLRFDYRQNDAAGTVNVTIVSEDENVSRLCGRLTLGAAEWKRLQMACGDSYHFDGGLMPTLSPSFFKFVDKGESR